MSTQFDTDKAEALLEVLAKEQVRKMISGEEIIELSKAGGEPYIVKIGHFRAALKHAGIAYPIDAVAFSQFAKLIGDGVLPKYRKMLKSAQINRKHKIWTS